MHSLITCFERHQVWLYLGGIAAGAIFGLAFSAAASMAETLIYPALGLLLYVTFVGIPISNFKAAAAIPPFLGTTFVLNFLLVPVVVFLVSRLVAHDHVVLLGVLIVLLTPCIDYVIVFAQLAGGDAKSLLAAAPVLVVVQVLLLPVYLWLFLGDQFFGVGIVGPLLQAFIWIILVPLVVAAVTQLAAKRWVWVGRVESGGTAVMVPLMVLTLAIVVASQISAVHERVLDLLLSIPVFVLFVALMILIGWGVARRTKMQVPQQRALVFSGVTRNSLVVLPIVLALPGDYALTPLVVVTQTLVELCIMVVCIRLIPRLIPLPAR
ncbi:arsenic resistance protein [Enteractinococcus helveticum]|uniref:Arsenic resistance protein n=1 Tax=Enteractinococcus helveticum TaxID=1837282 RepID=A0A1B7LYA0_9MICC|nr:bile acid:sodium symporter [Enteractinococcus helveticum]OAV60262.1 arsenic resistance protein [Enteractinococcus helveticum]